MTSVEIYRKSTDSESNTTLWFVLMDWFRLKISGYTENQWIYTDSSLVKIWYDTDIGQSSYKYGMVLFVCTMYISINLKACIVCYFGVCEGLQGLAQANFLCLLCKKSSRQRAFQPCQDLAQMSFSRYPWTEHSHDMHRKKTALVKFTKRYLKKKATANSDRIRYHIWQ